MMFVQAGLDRHMQEVIAEYIKKQMKVNSSYSTCSHHQVWKIRKLIAFMFKLASLRLFITNL